MKRRIIVEYGEVKRIALLMNCTPEMVSYSLAYRKNTRLAQAIRKMALMRGGVEVGDEPINDMNHGNDMAGVVQESAGVVEVAHRKTKVLCWVFSFQLHPATWNGRRKSLMAGYAGRAELRQFRTAVKTSADK